MSLIFFPSVFITMFFSFTVAHASGGMVSKNALQCETITKYYKFTGADQSFTVPTGVTSISVRIVAAAGGAGQSRTAAHRVTGGAGAVIEGIIKTTPGESLTVRVGGPGGTGAIPGAAGRGGAGGGGGGYSAIFRSTTLLALAGGGGGGGGNTAGTTCTGAGGDGDTDGGMGASGNGTQGKTGLGASATVNVSASAATDGAIYTGGNGGSNGTGGSVGGVGGWPGGGTGGPTDTTTNSGGGGGGGGFVGGGGAGGGTCAGGGGGGTNWYMPGIGRGSVLKREDTLFNYGTNYITSPKSGFVRISYESFCGEAKSTGKMKFRFTGDDTKWKVPAGVSSITVKVWGGAGGGASLQTAGAGGFVQSTLSVTAGEVLTLRVAEGAKTVNSGGGYSGVFRSTTPLLIAGGGGGAGAVGRGGGGGSTGGDGTSQLSNCGPSANVTCGGAGGTVSAGGTAPQCTAGYGTSVSGSSLQGGAGSNSLGTSDFATYPGGGGIVANNDASGGGGGGGYFGGSGGCSQSINRAGGGGGGSNYTTGTSVTNSAATTTGIPANSSDADYEPGIGDGRLEYTNLGSGLIVISW